MESEDNTELSPRNYQGGLMQIALKRNTIIFLPTGSGKTFIAVMVLKQMSEPLTRHWNDNGKITVMVVNTVALVHQHSRYIQRHTPFKVGEYTGEHNLDFWDKATWDEQCTQHQVLIMTCQILANGLERNVLDLNRINLLIFDECHRGVQDQPMRQIMMSFQHATSPPRVLGLTATLLNGNCTPAQVEKNVLDLEVTYHSQVATVNEISEAKIYSTNPHENVTSYDGYNLSVLDSEVIDELDKLQNTLLAMCCNTKGSTGRKELIDPNKHIKQLNNFLNDAKYHLTVLGSYGGMLALSAHIVQIESLKKSCTDSNLMILLNTVITSLSYGKLVLKRNFSGNVREDIIKHSSKKVKKLLKILSHYNDEPMENFCSIVFVQRRFTAKVIYQLLKLLSENHEDFNFIKCNFIVGYTCNPLNTRESMYGTKVNRQIINEFYSKTVNLLVASNVLEEGVDVPMCQLVVKFDEPLDYRAYIQSKGRARHKDSWYHIMVETQDYQKYYNRYSMFQELEKILNKYLIGKNELRNLPSEERIEEMYNEHEIEPYYTQGPGSAQITMVNACSLLSSYCNSFMSDMYTQYAPSWYIEFGPEGTCKVIIEMPTVCPYITPIEGPFMPSKKSAKRAAAFTACKILHKIGELDDTLKPKRSTNIEEDTGFLFSHYKDGRAAVANEKRNIYDIKIPYVCKGSLRPQQQSYLHLLEIKPKFKPNQHLTATMEKIYNSELTYALISMKAFVNICEFPVFVSSGELNVKLHSNYQTIILSGLDIYNLKQFTHFVYSDLIQVLKPYLVIDNDAMILLAPYSKNLQSINFDVIYDTMHVNPPAEMLSVECYHLDVTEETYGGRVVIPFYRSHLETVEYIVTRVCYEMSPLTKFPSDKDATYHQYFENKYNYCIKNFEQPLLEVKALSSKLDCTKPRGAQKKRNRETHENDVIHLVPEMVTKQDFPTSLWVQAKILPTVCDKIMQLLRAEELRVEIYRCTNIGVSGCSNWAPLKLDQHLITYEPDIYNPDEENNELVKETNAIEETNINITSIMAKMNSEIENNTIQSEYPWDPSEEPVDIERKIDVTVMEINDYVNFINKPLQEQTSIAQLRSFRNERQLLALTYDRDYIYNSINILNKEITPLGPELAEIYKALATAKCADIVNLERLETLGDSLLKFASSLYIILKFPTFNEGKSTTLKSQLVSNKNLLILGCQKNLGKYIKFFSLKPKQDWTPPGYILPENISNFITYNTSLNGILLTKEEQLSGIVQRNIVGQISELDTEPNEATDPMNSSTMFFMGKQCLINKCVSDCCEALIGAYLESCGIPGALNILNWLGVFPKSENIFTLLRTKPSSPILNPNASNRDIDFHIPQYSLLEKALGYKFKNRAYLLQAVTHSSYTINRITGSYQRLEFLGDAILDFLITCYIYENCQQLTPGDITDLRSALVNNVTFGCLAIKYGFHKHLLSMSNKLQGYIDRFVKYQENRNFVIDDEVIILLNEDYYHIAEYVDCPKVLGDMFEALAGAVYLDSDMDLETVWRVFHRMMWKEIDKFSNKVPKNPIRMLYETVGAHPKFHPSKVCDDGRILVKLDFLVNGVRKLVHGFGDHQKVAKKAAAKIALRLLEK